MLGGSEGGREGRMCGGRNVSPLLQVAREYARGRET